MKYYTMARVKQLILATLLINALAPTSSICAISRSFYSQRIATLLSLAGADPHHRNNKGHTPLMLAGPNMQKTIIAAQEIRAIMLAYVNDLKSLLPNADDFESARPNNRTFADFEPASQNNRTFDDFEPARLNDHTFFENPLPLDLTRLILDYSLLSDDQIQNAQVSWFLQHLIKDDPELTKAQERAHASDDAHAVAVIPDTPDGMIGLIGHPLRIPKATKGCSPLYNIEPHKLHSSHPKQCTVP